MRRGCFLIAAGLAMFLSRESASVLGATDERTDLEAAALVAELLSQRPSGNLAFEGTLKTRHKSGPWTRVHVRYEVRLREDSWEGIYEAGPTNAPPTERLVIVHHERLPNQYLHWRAFDPNQPKEPVKLAGGQASVPFAGGEFWLSDLGLEFLHWPKQRLLRTPSSPMKLGRPCRILESIHPHPGPADYARVVSWIDREFGGVISAEAFDSAGKLLKVFSVKAAFLKKAQVQELRIRNEKTDSRTYLEFQPETQATK